MSSILYNVFISPLELILEFIFEIIYRFFRKQPEYIGFAIIGVSIAVSLLSLPLYRRADLLQKKAREKQKQMAKWILHIKQTFKGNERFMILQEYYRLNNYSPFSALECAIPLLLQIPFFTAAYHFLSHLEILSGTSFGIIKDLGAPDGLLQFGSFYINVLPVLMTAFNCISALIYLKDFAFKDKFQTYCLAGVFLVLLYKSPAGLVLYWTCNNIFSLIKNAFYKLKKPRQTAYILCAFVGIIMTISIVVLLFQYISLLPLFCYLTRNQISKLKDKAFYFININVSKPSGFFFAGVFLTLLLGVLIPSSVIASSPAEFINLLDYRNPFLFLINSSCYAIGFFLVWMGIVYFMLSKNAKQILNILLWIFSCSFLLNYMCFGHKLGILSPLLIYENGVFFSAKEIIVNFLALIIMFVVCSWSFRLKKIISYIYIVLIICIGSISFLYLYNGQKLLNDMAYIKTSSQNSLIEPKFSLSKNGKNVILFMLDRAISGYVPYLFEEKPILKEQFSGFTYYPNTLSFGYTTNYGAPPLFGGYEYTPTEMNKRSSELLVNKHNEALKVLPVIFYKNHYKTTVCDPPLAGYKNVPDLSIFKDYPEIKTHLLAGTIKDETLKIKTKEKPLYKNKRNFICYSLFRVLPLAFSGYIYDKGYYLGNHKTEGKTISVDPSYVFDKYSVLTLLPKLTEIIDDKINTFLSIQNETPHQPFIFQLPDYELKENVNNSGYKTAADGHIPMKRHEEIAHYHINMATFIQLGKWFDYMKKNGVYDNTRIILVADHGKALTQFPYMVMKDYKIDVSSCNPLLMVKDFNSTGFKTSYEFMTNADAPTISLHDIIDKPINPFTDKVISSKEKTTHPQIITTSTNWMITTNNGTVFDTHDGRFLSVHDDIFKQDNWEFVGPGTAP